MRKFRNIDEQYLLNKDQHLLASYEIVSQDILTFLAMVVKKVLCGNQINFRNLVYYSIR